MLSNEAIYLITLKIGMIIILGMCLMWLGMMVFSKDFSCFGILFLLTSCYINVLNDRYFHIIEMPYKTGFWICVITLIIYCILADITGRLVLQILERRRKSGRFND